MGWKTLKEVYAISHIVHVIDGLIWIGSAHIPDIISVDNSGNVTWGELGQLSDPGLRSLFDELSSDKDKLTAAVSAKDVFSASIAVYCCADGQLITDYCERHGWPNCTHDGTLMYENVYFNGPVTAVRNGIKEAKLEAAHLDRRTKQTLNTLVQINNAANTQRAHLASLEARLKELKGWK